MKLIHILLTLIILSTIASASQTYYLDSPDSVREQAIKMNENDRIQFDMLDGTHTIILDKIVPKTGFIELDIFPYINKDPNDRQVAYVNIDQTHFATLDLNRDYINDLEIRLISLDGITGAFLRIDRIYKPIFPDKNINKEESKQDLKIPIAVTIAVFAIMFIIYLLIFRKPRA